MKTDFTDLELIDKYLKGGLKGSELTEFNSLLARDKSLQAAVQAYSIVIEGVKEAGRSSLRKKLSGLTRRLNKEQGRKANVPAASEVKENIKKALEKIYIKYFSPYEDLVTVRSNNKKSAYLNEAMHYYNTRNYEQAVKAFKEILKTAPGNVTVIFYYGVSLLELGKTDEALKAFRKVIKLDMSYFKEQAIWYTGLIYLKQYELPKAINLFSTITPDYTNYSFAQKILKTLQKLEP